ncbi:hypothetical protein ACP275_07G044900 [Erythranthe tilingii]
MPRATTNSRIDSAFRSWFSYNPSPKRNQWITSFLSRSWVDIEPSRGGLVINIADLFQLMSNRKFVSNKHRVVANKIGPRISVACFFSGPVREVKVYGPIKELIFKENPTKYRDIILSDYMLKFLKVGLDENLGLDYYKL